jgi:hypothetical protein
MNRRNMMIAAVTAIGAVTLAAGPGQSQQQSALDATIGSEAPAPRAGALAMPRLKLGQKGTADEKTVQVAPGGNATKLQMAPSVDVPIENK